MKIIRCDRTHDLQWDSFVKESPRASFYHRIGWRDINERCFGHQTTYLAAIEGDRMVGVFPLVRLKSVLFGNVACSMPFVNYGGPCGDTDDIERELLIAAEGVAEEWGVDYLEIRGKRRLDERYPCSEHKVSMSIELDADPEVILGRLKREQRAEIRRAYKKGFTAKFGPGLIDDFYAVLSEGWRDLGTPIYHASYLKAVLSTFADSTKLCVIYADDGTPVAGAFDGIHNGTVEGMWLGMRSESRKQLVGYVLYWELIRQACEDGHQRFHLGRSSKDSGGEQFKKKWNAEAIQLYWHYVLRKRTRDPELESVEPQVPSWRSRRGKSCRSP